MSSSSSLKRPNTYSKRIKDIPHVDVSINLESEYVIELDCAILTLPQAHVQALQRGIEARLRRGANGDMAQYKKKLVVYAQLLNKLVDMNDIKMQEFLRKIKSEQAVIMAKVAGGNSLKEKFMRNMPMQTRRVFEDDYDEMQKITLHQAVNYVEEVLPLLKSLAK